MGIQDQGILEGSSSCFAWIDVALHVVLVVDSGMLGIEGHLIHFNSHNVRTGLPPRPI